MTTSNDTTKSVEDMTEEERRELNYNFRVNRNIPPRYKDCSKETIPKEIKEKINQAMKEKKGIFLYGEAGTGKTYIMYSILKEFYKEGHESTMFTDMPWLSMRIKNYIRDNEDPQENVKIYTTPEYLFLDDFGVEKMTDFLFETLYLIIDTRYNYLKPTFISSNYSLKEIAENINDRIASRISEMCVVIKVEGKDKRVK